MCCNLHRKLHDHRRILSDTQSGPNHDDRCGLDVRGVSVDRVRDAKLRGDCQMIDQLEQFLEGHVYQSLITEAEHNDHAQDVLDIIHMCIDSAFFFASVNEQHRVDRELRSIANLINMLTKLYEE